MNLAIESSRALAYTAMANAIPAMSARGFGVRARGLLTASGKPLPRLEKILASHASIHAAEGEMFGDAFAHAAAKFGLAVTRIKEREILERCTAVTGLAPWDLERELAANGKRLGPPWRQDEKYATLAGLIALDCE